MPQKNNGKSNDPRSGGQSAQKARALPGFSAAVGALRLVDTPTPANPSSWGAQWQPLPAPSQAGELFCIAIDGSLPPRSQSLAMPPRPNAATHFSFFPVAAWAIPWPSSFVKKLPAGSPWTTWANHAFAGCSAGSVSAIPGHNVGHGPDLAPLPSFLSAAQASLERPWSEWGFEKLHLGESPRGNDTPCPASTLATLVGASIDADDPIRDRGALLCPSCGTGHTLECGTPTARAESIVASGGVFEYLFVCRSCSGMYRSMAAITSHLANTPEQRALSLMELMENLLYVELVERAAHQLSKPESDFSQIVKLLGARPLLLIKDGPLVVSPTSKLASYLQSWALHKAYDHRKNLVLFGIEKNSAVLSELAREFALGRLAPGQFCALTSPAQLSWEEDATAKDRSKWAQKFAAVLPQGVCIISTPDLNRLGSPTGLQSKPGASQATLAQDLTANLGHVFGSLGKGAQPSTEGKAFFPLLAHLQKQAALPAKEKAMALFAYDKIVTGGKAFALAMGATVPPKISHPLSSAKLLSTPPTLSLPLDTPESKKPRL